MLTVFSDSGAEGAPAAAAASGHDYIIRYATPPDPEALAAFQAAIGAELVETTQAWGFELWHCETALDAATLASFADADWYGEIATCVAYLEENVTLDAAAFSADPRSNDLWALDNAADTDIDLPEAWETSRGAGVLVAVLDTGVDYTHPDLAANIWTNPGEIAGNGIDDDGNGHVDDIHGYDFVYTDADPMDGHSHGTHVAGTIAAVADNGIGVAGVAPEAQIMAIKILSDQGSGSIFDAIQGIEYAAMMGARIANASWGGSGAPQALSDAIAMANGYGMALVAAAGNASSNTDLSPHYPSSIDQPNVISVAASTRDDTLASFSNYGFLSVDVTAPGVSILSTTPGAGYGVKSGTSMAAPHVTGIAALILAQEPDLTPAALRQRLIETSDPVAALAARSVSGGRVNAAAAVETGGTATVSGRVEDAAGKGMAGWLVFLDRDGDGTRDAEDSFTRTAADGSYRFDGLAYGHYRIAAELPPGYLPAGTGAGPHWRVEDIAAPWRDLGSEGQRLDLGDEGSARLELPFGMSFFGRSFEAITVTANVLITFGIPGNTFRISGMDAAPAYSIAPYWADLSTLHGGQVRVLREADAVTIAWDGVRGASGAGRFSFEAVLARDGSITFGYGAMSGSPGAASIGLKGGDAAGAVTVAALPVHGALRFTDAPPKVALAEVEARAPAVTAPVIEVESRAQVFAEYGLLDATGGVAVAFAQDFTDPVVFLLSPADQPGGTAPGLVSVDAAGFTLAAAPGAGWGYLAVETGRWFLDAGTMIEAGTAGPGRVAFAGDFAAPPLVFAAAQTGGPGQPAETGIDRDGFALTLEATGDGGFGADSLGWLAIDPTGIGALGLATAGIAADSGGAALLLTSLASTRSTAGSAAETADARTRLALPEQGTLSGVASEGQRIEGRVWLDLDGDGLREDGETGLAGQWVWLDRDGDGVRDADETATRTDAEGRYAFGGLAPGAYSVRHDLPPGWTGTAPAGSGGYGAGATAVSWADPGEAALRIEGLGDDRAADLDLPFLFPFFGAGQSRVTVSANGYLCFGGDGRLAGPGDAAAGPAIAVFRADLDLSSGRVEAWSSADGRAFHIRWTDATLYGGEGGFAFETVLAEDGSVRMVYGDLAGIPADIAAGLVDGRGQVLAGARPAAHSAVLWSPAEAEADALDLVLGQGAVTAVADFGMTAADGAVLSSPESWDSDHFDLAAEAARHWSADGP